jgi:hypothetical protein
MNVSKHLRIRDNRVRSSSSFQAGSFRRSLLGGCARAALLALPVLPSLGIVLPGAAQAQTTLTSTSGQDELASFGTGNPFTIDTGTTIGSIYGDESRAWTLTNQGAVVTGSGALAIDLQGGGTVANGSGGFVSGTVGIYMLDAGSVTNAGTILGTGGGSSDGIILRDGGYISNGSTGVIVGATGQGNFSDSGKGILSTGDTTVVNAGTILQGIRVLGGGSVLTNSNGGIISGGGAYFGNLNNNIDNPDRVVNAGTIQGSGGNSLYSGVYMGSGGSVTNSGTSSLISGGTGFQIRNRPGTLKNQATVKGS